MILVRLWTRTDFRRTFKIIPINERYDGTNKMKTEQHCVIAQTVPYKLEQRNWKQKVPRRNNRTWKMAKWDFGGILTLERRRKTPGWMPWDNWLHLWNSDWILAARVQQQLMFHLTKSLLDNWLKNNDVTVHIIYYLRSHFVTFFLRILVFKFISQPQNAEQQNSVATG